MRPKVIANSISFIRVPLALVLIVCFQPDIVFLRVAFLALVASYISDLGDGYIARKLSVASTEGQLWDSLADKAVYIGAVVAMNNSGILHPVIVWSLILRDVGMYVSRIVYVDRLDQLRDLKAYSYAHCALIYSTIILGFNEMQEMIENGTFGSLLLVNIAAVATFTVGAIGSAKFIFMKETSTGP